ncbi:unnamed protein product [Vicia faba]|uniref:Uncharacterized protein n=1 Tax=Vicia faba TaxID=3906 RepID=A0AAV0Z304_VICFA|nr:unnamed protein product [Vicia faba]
MRSLKGIIKFGMESLIFLSILLSHPISHKRNKFVKMEMVAAMVEKNIEDHVSDIMEDMFETETKPWYRKLRGCCRENYHMCTNLKIKEGNIHELNLSHDMYVPDISLHNIPHGGKYDMDSGGNVIDPPLMHGPMRNHHLTQKSFGEKTRETIMGN